MLDRFQAWSEKGRFLSGRTSRSAAQGKGSRGGRSRVPLFELLEQRAMLTIFSPSVTQIDSTSSTDNNLRAAIFNANNDNGTGTDTINLSAGTYSLAFGELAITNTAHTLIIDGQGSSGANATIIDQLALDRVFEIAPNATVVFENLEITGGVSVTDDSNESSSGPDGGATGGGISSDGNITLNNVLVTGNKVVATGAGATAAGGGVWSAGSLSMTNSVIEGNSVTGGAVGQSQGDGLGLGGGLGIGLAVGSTNTVSIQNSTIADNTAFGGAEGGFGSGGGIYVSSGAAASDPVIINGDTITGNQALGGSSSGGDGAGNGGGITVDTENLGSGVTDSQGNTTEYGGPVQITNSSISYNSAQGASGGSGGFGGGVIFFAGGSSMLNDTVYGNSAIAPSSSGSGQALGGGIDDESAFSITPGLSLVNITLVNNTTQAGGTNPDAQGGGISNTSETNNNTDSNLVVENSLVAGNTATNGTDFFGPIATAQNNLIGNGTDATGITNGTNGNLVGTTATPINPQLGTFALNGSSSGANGGGTATVPLESGSQAINAGSNADFNAAYTADRFTGTPTDQRGTGFNRIVGSAVDIGAYEYQTTTAATTTTLKTSASSAAAGASVTLTATVTSGTAGTPTGFVTFQDTVGSVTGTIATVALSGGSAAFTSISLPPGASTVTAIYSGDTTFSGSASSATGISENITSTGGALSAIPSAADGTTGSLRAAIATADADTTNSTDVIILQAGTYVLTQGELDIQPATATGHTIIIEGQGSSGANATIIDQLTLDRVLQVAAGTNVTLENLQVTGGLADDDGTTNSDNETTAALGGGILTGSGNNIATPGGTTAPPVNSGTLTLNNVAIVNNKAAATGDSGVGADGGGLESTGTLIVNGASSLIAGNSAIAGVGAVDATNAQGVAVNSEGGAGGGGIATISGTTITGATISGNAALGGQASPGAGGVSGTNSGAGSVGNIGGTGVGGGMSITVNGTQNATLTQNTVSGNLVVGGLGGSGGAGAVQGNTQGTGGAGGQATAGGAYVDATGSGTIQVNGNTFTNNGTVAGAGGAGGSTGIAGNVFAGGFYFEGDGSGPTTVDSNSITGNTLVGGLDATAQGGGTFLENGGSTAIQFNTNTITGNLITNAFAGGLFGGGMYVTNAGSTTAAFTLSNDTIESNQISGVNGNSVTDGAGAYIDNDGDSPLVMDQSLLSGNMASTGNDGEAQGGGLFFTIDSNSTSTATGEFDSDTFQSNSITAPAGDAVENSSDTADTASTVQGGGLYVDVIGVAGATFKSDSFTSNTGTITEFTGTNPGGGANAVQGGGAFLLTASSGTTSGLISISGATVSSNSISGTDGTNAFGGGVFAEGTAQILINSSTITNNSATGGTGIANNPESPQSSAVAGGLYITSGATATDTLNEDTISDNTATGGAGPTGGTAGTAFGGGLVVASNSGGSHQGPVLVSASTINNNNATGGAGIGTASVGGNAEGGGVGVTLIGTDFDNDTIYGNTALSGTGQTAGNAIGGGLDDLTGIENSSSVVVGGITAINVTVVGNTAQVAAPTSGGTAGKAEGGGIANDPTFGHADPSLEVGNTLIARNSAKDQSSNQVAANGEDVFGSVALANNDLIGNYNATAAPGYTAAADDDLLNEEPTFTGTSGAPVLANNGGPTNTIALAGSSAGIAAGSTAVLQPQSITTDQRGLPRTINNAVDIGSVENQQLATITPSGNTGTYEIGTLPTQIDPTVGVSGDDLSKVTVTISNGTFLTGDSLGFTNQPVLGITGSYNSTTGVLTLSGTASAANYQSALQTVTFSTTNNTSTSRTFSYQPFESGVAGTAATEKMNVIINGPVVTPSGNTNTYDVGGAPVAVDSGLNVTYSVLNLVKATVTITNPQAGDTLNFTNANGITGSYNATNGTLTLTGTVTVATYKAALDSITFSTTSTDPVTRAITVQVNGSQQFSNVANESVDVVAGPVVTPSGATNTYTVGGVGVAVDSGVTVSSSSANLTKATVTISAGTLQPGDTLSFVNQNGITGTYAGGVLTLSGNATVAQYQTALQSVLFTTSSTSTTARALSIVATSSSSGNPAAETVDVTTQDPTVQSSNQNNTFTIGGTPVAVDSQLTLGPSGTVLTGATVTITSQTLQSGDVLHFTNTGNITGGFSGGVLTLHGTATVAQYQAALDSITFSTTSTNTTTRAIGIQTLDQTLASNDAAASVGVSVPPPVVTLSSTTNTFKVGGSPVAVDSGITVTSPDADLSSATLTISTATLQSGDTLIFTTQNGITGTYADGVLTLVGSATVADYQAALRSVDFSTTTKTSSVTRSIAVEALDNSLKSTPVTKSVDVIGDPIVTPSGNIATFTIGKAPVAVDSGVKVTSNDTDLTGATVTISTGTLQTGDSLGFTNQNGISGVYNATTGTLTLTGNASVAEYQTALQSVVFSTTSALTPTSTRTLNITADDGVNLSGSASETLNADLPPPVVTLSSTTNTFKVTGTAVAVDAGITVTAQDADLTGATLTISSGTLQSGDTLNFTNQNGITGTYADGVLTLAGTASVANYQTALQSVTFSTTTQTSSVARAISIEAFDTPLLGSTSVTKDVDVIGDPTVTPSGNTATFNLSGPAVAVDSGVKVTSNDTDLTGATVTISSTTLQTGDSLGFTTQNGITGTFANGVLTLVGSATVADYQTALQSVTFSTTATSTTNSTRTLTIVAEDGSLSGSATETVDVSVANASLSGTIFDDVNQNGSFDSGEPTLANITVTLSGTNSSGATVSQTAITGSDGTYTFTKLAAGTYTLSAAIPTDLMAGSGIVASGNSGTVAGESISAITLAAGTTLGGYNFSALGVTQQLITVNLFLASTPSPTQILNDGPTISAVADQTVTEGSSTSALPITLSDSLSPASLSLGAASSNTTLVPTSNIVFGGSGDNRTITVTPAANQTGTATITTTVTDLYGNASEMSFTLTVAASSASSDVLPAVVNNAINQSPSSSSSSSNSSSVTPASSSVSSVSPVSKTTSAVDSALDSEDSWT